MIIIKTLFIAVVMLIFVAFSIMNIIVAAERSNKQKNEENIEETDDMLLRKQTCSKCKIGKESYELDRHSAVCPYIACWGKGKCQFYEPIEKTSKSGIFRKKSSETVQNIDALNDVIERLEMIMKK